MLTHFITLPLFGWIWSGHHQMTTVALSAALMSLTTSGKLARLGVTMSQLRLNMSALWLFDCCQDISIGNAVGLCGVEVPGGQVAHFMRESKEKPAHAYSRCIAHIRNACVDSWRCFNAAFHKKKHHGGLLGAIESGVEAIEHVVDPMLIVADGGLFLDGQKNLAKALHTMQDAFSPAHVLRDSSAQIIKDIYTWDDANKNPRPKDGWPGHHTYDNPSFNWLTDLEARNARAATADLIGCVLEQVHEPETVFRVKLEGFLSKRLAKSF